MKGSGVRCTHLAFAVQADVIGGADRLLDGGNALSWGDAANPRVPDWPSASARLAQGRLANFDPGRGGAEMAREPDAGRLRRDPA